MCLVNHNCRSNFRQPPSSTAQRPLASCKPSSHAHFPHGNARSFPVQHILLLATGAGKRAATFSKPVTMTWPRYMLSLQSRGTQRRPPSNREARKTGFTVSGREVDQWTAADPIHIFVSSGATLGRSLHFHGPTSKNGDNTKTCHQETMTIKIGVEDGAGEETFAANYNDVRNVRLLRKVGSEFVETPVKRRNVLRGEAGRMFAWF
ncbi:uncharacterized protein LOC125153066 [Prionailurus viverrinus]|uniref:uncharacterized protein LOC125153066 n=1 Tax=Prionailurus viverrinus TaxID=61388 RepID=UPI001FF1FE11|nr:uncharacterized protein LOC125153066 [Prionailurus viverrinus]